MQRGTMTNSNGNRDEELELIRQLLIATANRSSATDSRLDRLVESQDRTQGQLDQLAVKQDRTQEQLDQLGEKVDRISEDVEIAFQTITALSNNTDSAIASINATLERQDRILDYLMRGDRNGSGESPQG